MLNLVPALDASIDTALTRISNQQSAIGSQNQTYIQHSSKPRSDVGRRKKFKLGSSFAAPIF
jgi:hypothetical protein